MRRSSRPANPSNASIEIFPTADEIAALAHDLFVSGGRRIADIPEHWRVAERELLNKAARRVLSQRASRWQSYKS